MHYRVLADAVLLVHLAVVVFIVGGLVAVFVGHWRGWHWVSSRRFRLLHLAAIGVVVLQAWLGRICPLTTLEHWLRVRAGLAAYEGSFIEHWVERVLYYDAPGWVFATVYTLYGAVVLAAWRLVPPIRRRAHSTAR